MLLGPVPPFGKVIVHTCKHISTGVTPFEITYGRHPLPLIRCDNNPLNDQLAVGMLTTHEEVMNIARSNLQWARDRMKSKVVTRGMEKQFEIRDEVLVKLKKYHQTSLAQRRSNKFEKQFFGPYKVVERIREVAYKLTLSTGSKIHNVFHVALLNQFVRGKETISSEIPKDLMEIEDDPIIESGGDVIVEPTQKRGRRTPSSWVDFTSNY